MHGGAAGSGAAIGNRNVLKKGVHTATEVGLRRQYRKVLGDAKQNVARIDSIIAACQEAEP